MTARMTNPAFAVPAAMDALNALSKAISRTCVPISHELVHLRASQINDPYGRMVWEQLQSWTTPRIELPVGPLLCVINGPTRGRPWSGAAA